MSPLIDKQIYEGKAKKVFSVKNSTELIIFYKDSLTAFNAEKKAEMKGKGNINHQIDSYLHRFLQKNNIETHYLKSLGDNECLVKPLEMIPLEVVVRNASAGSLSKRFGLKEGEKLKAPLFELYYKKDELNDPFISSEQVLAFDFASEATLKKIKSTALKVNDLLVSFFDPLDIDLVDFKIEFGFLGDKIILGDEMSPDSCRLWDKKTQKKMDKDRFRRDLGDVLENYSEVLSRIKSYWGDKI